MHCDVSDVGLNRNLTSMKAGFNEKPHLRNRKYPRYISEVTLFAHV